jgi:hypothetical protein
MTTSQRMIKNLYRDSVSLMQFSEKLHALDGIKQASAVMATENNISLLVEAGLLASAVPPSPNDLLIVVEGRDEASTGAALEKAEAMLKQKSADAYAGEGGVRRVPPAQHRDGARVHVVCQFRPDIHARRVRRGGGAQGIATRSARDDVQRQRQHGGGDPAETLCA